MVLPGENQKVTEGMSWSKLPGKRCLIPIMLGRISSLAFLVFTCSLWAQHSRPSKGEEAAIERVKAVPVSSLDRALPAVTLEFFLKYEGEGTPIQWKMTTCGELESGPLGHERGTGLCVRADVGLTGDRSATIEVSVRTVEKGPFGVPTFFRATVTDPSGSTHALRRLRDLPMALHRPLPKSPRDLPLPDAMACTAPPPPITRILPPGSTAAGDV